MIDKSIKGAYNLPIQTVTIVPSTTDKSKVISAAYFDARIKKTRRELSKLFGGYTSVEAVGGYLLKGKVIREKVAMVTAYATEEAFKRNKSKWISWVKHQGKSWKQDSMGVIIENDLMYI